MFYILNRISKFISIFMIDFLTMRFLKLDTILICFVKFFFHPSFEGIANFFERIEVRIGPTTIF
jgi:hypothetical protein